jgi:hypothetical protein
VLRDEAIPSANSIQRSIKKLTARFPGLSQSFAILITYLGWSVIFKMMSLTLVTYFVLSGGGAETPRLEDVNEALATSQLPLLALCVIAYVFLLRVFQASTQASTQAAPFQLNDEFFSPQKIESRFLPGFLNGAVLAAGITLAFLLGGIYRYLGFFIQADRAPLALVALLIRVASTVTFVYCEEFIFRHRILRCLTRRNELDQSSPSTEFWHRVAAVTFTGAMFVGMKFYQFDLGWMQALSLFLVAFTLGIRALSTDFTLSAGFWAAVLIVFQALLSLPILGNEFSGLILIKYQSLAPEAPAEALGLGGTESSYGETLRFITGGPGGPLASLTFQLLILLDIVRGTLRYRRQLMTRS